MERTAPSRAHRIERLVAVAAVAIVVAGCSAGKPPTWSYAPATAAPAASAGAASAVPASAAPGSEAPSASAAAGSPGPAASGAVAVTSTIEIEAFDLGFKPSAVTVAAAGTYDVTFKNTGSIAHDLTFADGTKTGRQRRRDRRPARWTSRPPGSPSSAPSQVTPTPG